MSGFDGREGRVDTVQERRRGIRNGLPETMPYTYRGTGNDILTGDKTAQQIHAETLAHEGTRLLNRPPLYASDFTPAERRPGTPGTLCGRTLTSRRAHGATCGRNAGHTGQCLSASALAARNDAQRRRKAREGT